MAADDDRLSQSTPAGSCTCSGPVAAPPVLTMSKLTVFWVPRSMPLATKPGVATNCGSSGLTDNDSPAEMLMPSAERIAMLALPLSAPMSAAAVSV